MFNAFGTLYEYEFDSVHAIEFDEHTEKTAMDLHKQWIAPGALARTWYSHPETLNANNSGLEEKNGRIKEQAKLDALLAELLEHSIEWVRGESEVRAPGYVNEITWRDEPRTTPSLWINANYLQADAKRASGSWLMLDYEAVAGGDGPRDGVCVLIAYVALNRRRFPPGLSKAEYEERGAPLVEAFRHLSWACLKDYCDFMNEYSIVVKENGKWICHCREFTKCHVCECVLAVQLRRKEVALPSGCAVFERSKRKVGAPKHARRTGGRFMKHSGVESDNGEADDGDPDVSDEDGESVNSDGDE
jgi:hypothetical protein